MPEKTVSRSTLRNQRRERKAALITFVSALGYDPTRVRSLDVRDGKITLHLFVPYADDPTRNTVVETEHEGTNKALIEIGLLFTETDLDLDEKAADEVKDFGNFLEGKPLDRDAFGRPKG